MQFQSFDGEGNPSFMRRHYLIGYIWGLVSTILFIVTLIILISKCSSGKYYSTKVPSKSIIPIKQSINDTITGAAAHNGKENHIPSKYFTEFDFYNAKPTKTLKILENFQTYQQTTEYSCGPAAALMALNYLGITNVSERQLSDSMFTGYPWRLNNFSKLGTTTTDMARVLGTFNVNVETNAGAVEPPWSDEIEFTKWIKNAIENKQPVLSKHVDWGGHWEVIIGYDDMGTESFSDDVLIIADPYDSSDHRQDGYTIWPMERYYSLWHTKMSDQPLEEYYFQYVKISKK
ncbi:hypothetical protein TVAG_149750 [Trichomonas vaginalis G3]|uniref:Peptidase C39-like domain-containing protein n=1 Tax=Trichomonas vaginalis (strain ATCC PRA-98 / G3) TaxID=412133 RepID=A2FIK8_TRIV3|nr:papain-like cysteine protease AvrRpt2 [Trichomonas vaginalis G3]EAX95257.1 hypothetical protein TVAG_149750 [Trichomonas vaginalis G3]KAI5531913.1 papain-like cysteine protease AvrRpt2 [Trichomonas vaginalis G3]|eukprot:XP_001308187.1 hypothetical protein [Trichomonas vaginalis G3]